MQTKDKIINMFNHVFVHLLFKKMYSVLKVSMYVQTYKRVHLIIHLDLPCDISNKKLGFQNCSNFFNSSKRRFFVISRYLVDDVMGFYEMGDISPYKMGNIFPYEVNKFLSVLLTEMKNWPGLPRTLWGGPPARFFFHLESVACK